MTEMNPNPENDALEITIETVQEALEDTKAEELVVYYLKQTAVCDVVMIATSNNPNHSRALIRSVVKALKTASEEPGAEEETSAQASDQSDGWAVVDLNTIMVHVLNKEMRDFYGIDAWFAEKSDQVVHL